MNYMKLQRWLFIFVGICMLFLAAGCSGKPAADDSIATDQETDTATDLETDTDIDPETDTDIDQETDTEKIDSTLNDGQPTPQTIEWKRAVGTWRDEYNHGYTMNVSTNENEEEILFSISFSPRGGVTLDWVLPCKLDGEILHYNNGVMEYMEIVPGEDGEPAFNSSTEKELIGTFSFDSDSDILSWYNGPEEDDYLVNFVRSDYDASFDDGLSYDTDFSFDNDSAIEETPFLSEYVSDEYLMEALDDPQFDVNNPNCIYNPADDAQKTDEELSDYEFEQKYGYFFGYTQDFGKIHVSGSDPE